MDQQPDPPQQLPNFPRQPTGTGPSEDTTPFPWAAFIIALVVIVGVVGAVLAVRDNTSGPLSPTENLGLLINSTTTNEDTLTEAQTATVVTAMTPEEVGKGEVIFIGSAKKPVAVRQIQLFNPFKQSWVLVYDGYREISPAPMEVFKARLGALTYTKVQVVTTEAGPTDLGKELTVKKNETTNFSFEL